MSKMKILLMAIIVIVAVTFTSCGGDDEEPNNPDLPNALVINGNSYGSLPYAQFIDWDDGTASFVFSSKKMVSNIDVNSPLTFLSVRIPYKSTGIPTGTFSNNADADFDVNRIISTEECEMTGWTLDLKMTVKQNGDNFIVDFTTDDLHIFHSDEETGNGQSGSLTMHYEGNIEALIYQEQSK